MQFHCFSSFSAIEYVPTRHRSFIGNVGFAIGFTMAGTYLAWLIKYLEDWKLFHYVVYSQAVVVLITPWYMFTTQESTKLLLLLS